MGKIAILTHPLFLIYFFYSCDNFRYLDTNNVKSFLSLYFLHTKRLYLNKKQMKQLFYLVCIIVLMIIAYRLMKKVDTIPGEDKRRSPDEWREKIEELEREMEDTREQETENKDRIQDAEEFDSPQIESKENESEK